MSKTATAKMRQSKKRGRPAAAVTEDPRGALLDAAEERFAEFGYAVTSLREVAEAAGVNAAMVHYYFGNKSGLLSAVLDRALTPMAEALAASRQDPETDIARIAGMLFDMAGRHPALPKLIVREVMLSGGDTQVLFIEHYAPRLGGALPGLVRQAQDQGLVSPDLDPGIAALMVISLCIFPFVARSIAEPQLGIRYDAEGRARYLRHIEHLFQKGIGP